MNIKENKFFKMQVSSCERLHGKGYVGTISTNRPMSVERFAQICNAVYEVLAENKVSFNDYILIEDVIHRTIRTECEDKSI